MASTATSRKRSGAKMDRKFNRTARDIDRALAAARLAPLKAFLVERAREACWAVATMLRTPPVPFRLDLKALASVLGVRLDTLAEVHNWLVAAGIFRATPEAPGLFLIEKDYRAWIDPATGRPLIPQSLADDAARSAKLTVADVQGWAQLAIPERKKRDAGPEIPAVMAPEKSGEAAPENSGNPSDSRKNPEILRKNPEPHIEERVRAQSLTESLRNRQDGARPETPEPDTIPIQADPSPNLLTAAERQERDAALAECDRLFPMLDDISRAVSERRGGYPVAWYRPALRAMAREDRGKYTAKYLMGILGRFEQTGGPSAAPSRSSSDAGRLADERRYPQPGEDIRQAVRETYEALKRQKARA